MHWFRNACGFTRLRDANSFLPFQQTTRALTLFIFSRRSISDSGYEMINDRAYLVISREFGLRARAHICNSSSVRIHRFRFGLSETLQHGSIRAFEFVAPEIRNQVFAEHGVIRDIVSDIKFSNFFGFFAFEPGKNKETPTIADSIAKG